MTEKKIKDLSGKWIEYGDQIGIPAVLMRGGSSKGLFFRRDNIPEDSTLQDKVLLSVYGSPDKRQIDGLGGADPLTSKAIIISKSKRPNIDIEYLFAQVGIESEKVSYGGNCGNMLSGVGPFAIDEGMVEPVEPITTLRILNLNTNQLIISRVPVKNGKASTEGAYNIAGVPKPGAEIALSFLDPKPTSGKILPTGNGIDYVDFEDRKIAVSLVDAVTPFVFVTAKDLEFVGVRGNETVEEISSNTELLNVLEKIRSKAAVWMGLVDSADKATRISPNIPRVLYVSRPNSNNSLDIIVRQMSMQRPHKAFSVTGSICTAVASTIDDTVVNKIISSKDKEQSEIRIGHPSGIIRVKAGYIDDFGNKARCITISRTARRLMSGYVFVRKGDVFSS